MNTQQFLLRIMLWSLAIAAIFGTGAVVFARGDWVWQVIGTGIAAAVACALLLPASTMAERPATRAAGLLGMAVVILELIGSLILIWELPRTFGLRRVEESIGVTMALLAVATLFSISALKAMNGRFGRKPSWCVIGVIAATFVCFELATWYRVLPIVDDDKWWETGGAIFALLGIAVLCYAGNDELPRRLWRYVGTASAIVAWLLAMEEIWYRHNSAMRASLFAWSCALATAIAHVNLCLFTTLKPGQRWVRTASIIATSTAAATVALIITHDKMNWRFLNNNDNGIGRFVAAVAIIAACGSLALLVLSRMNAKTEFQTETDDLAQIDLFCPRCRKRQSIAPGESKCTHCDLKIEVRFEEPRCTTCEYLLVGLTGDICPECGNSIASLSP